MDNWIILGVGNPGDKYANTKHNVPWWILDNLQKKLSLYKKYQKKEKNYLEVRFDLDEYSIYTIYPTTFVNNSGLAIKDLLDKDKFSLDKTIVISDDIKLKTHLKNLNLENTNLLLMSSGNFNKMNLDEI